MKKTITLILTLALVVLCFAACGKSAAPAATEAPAEASAAAMTSAIFPSTASFPSPVSALVGKRFSTPIYKSAAIAFTFSFSFILDSLSALVKTTVKGMIW